MPKPKLNDELIQKLGDEIRGGLPVIYACDLLGVHNSSYYEWMKQGEKDYLAEIESIHAKLWSTIKNAYATYVKTAKEEMKIRERGWQAIAWWLERTNPFFMPKQQIQADDDGKVTVVIGGKQKDVKKNDSTK